MSGYMADIILNSVMFMNISVNANASSLFSITSSIISATSI